MLSPLRECHGKKHMVYQHGFQDHSTGICISRPGKRDPKRKENLHWFSRNCSKCFYIPSVGNKWAHSGWIGCHNQSGIRVGPVIRRDSTWFGQDSFCIRDAISRALGEHVGLPT